MRSTGSTAGRPLPSCSHPADVLIRHEAQARRRRVARGGAPQQHGLAQLGGGQACRGEGVEQAHLLAGGEAEEGGRERTRRGEGRLGNRGRTPAQPAARFPSHAQQRSMGSSSSSSGPHTSRRSRSSRSNRLPPCWPACTSRPLTSSSSEEGGSMRWKPSTACRSDLPKRWCERPSTRRGKSWASSCRCVGRGGERRAEWHTSAGALPAQRCHPSLPPSAASSAAPAGPPAGPPRSSPPPR